MDQFPEKIEILQADVDVKEHYEKKKQAELDSIKASNTEKGSLGEIMVKATPSKQAGELREKLAKSESELSEY